MEFKALTMTDRSRNELSMLEVLVLTVSSQATETTLMSLEHLSLAVLANRLPCLFASPPLSAKEEVSTLLVTFTVLRLDSTPTRAILVSFDGIE